MNHSYVTWLLLRSLTHLTMIQKIDDSVHINIYHNIRICIYPYDAYLHKFLSWEPMGPKVEQDLLAGDSVVCGRLRRHFLGVFGGYEPRRLFEKYG